MGERVSALPVVLDDRAKLPDYLPARMVNEFAYCPRLFYYEWVEGLFEESSDTVEGEIQHSRVDEKATALPRPGDLPEKIHARSVTLSSERLRVIAKLDLVEADGGVLTPVDYKHGRPREGPNGLELWPSDRAQLAVQGIVLRDNGYRCDEGIVYYRKNGPTRPRGVRPGSDRGNGRLDPPRLEHGSRRRDSAAARRFAEMPEVLARGDLPAG